VSVHRRRVIYKHYTTANVCVLARCVSVLNWWLITFPCGYWGSERVEKKPLCACTSVDSVSQFAHAYPWPLLGFARYLLLSLCVEHVLMKVTYACLGCETVEWAARGRLFS
jgi:hypothetical protein